MKRFMKYALVLAIAVTALSGVASAAVNDIWFGAASVNSGSGLDVYMSTNGTFFGFGLAVQKSATITGLTFVADSAFLTAIGGNANVALNAAGELANGSTGYVFETYALIPDKAQWSGKVGTITATTASAGTLKIWTDGESYSQTSVIFDTINQGTWVGNTGGGVKTANVITPEPGSLLALGMGLMGLAGFAVRKRK